VPHQDNRDDYTPAQALKELLENILPANSEFEARHGNATVPPFVTALAALIAFGLTEGNHLTNRCMLAFEAVGRLIPSSMGVFTTRQGLHKALVTAGRSLIEQVCSAISRHLAREKSWLLYGKPTFGVDGTKFLLPRTKANQEYFSAAMRKKASSYKKKADLAKAASPQCQLSLCLHLGTYLPFCWKASSYSLGERGSLLGMLSSIPKNSRFVMDAFYYGYELWTVLIAQGFTFVVRAGSNIEVTRSLKGLNGKLKRRGNLVFYWPANAAEKGKPPIVLLLVEVVVGKKRMFLITNELTLADHELADLYQRRWGIEVFFRTVKQSWQRTKLVSRTPQNALVEIDWTLLGIWASLWLGRKQTNNKIALSPVKVLRTIAKLVCDTASKAPSRWNLSRGFAQCAAHDESGRITSKDSRNYPRKNKKKATGTPIIYRGTAKLQEIAEKSIRKILLPA
jgi:hypothetical protein